MVVGSLGDEDQDSPCQFCGEVPSVPHELCQGHQGLPKGDDRGGDRIGLRVQFVGEGFPVPLLEVLRPDCRVTCGSIGFNALDGRLDLCFGWGAIVDWERVDDGMEGRARWRGCFWGVEGLEVLGGGF